jgi:Domain of unknown function (DUF4136)
MRIGCSLLAISFLCLTPFTSIAQEVVPYAKYQIKVDWVRGTDFSKYKTYAWGPTDQVTPNPHPRVDIDGALQAKGLREVGMDANPSLIVAFSGKNKLVYAIQKYPSNPIAKEGNLVVELADPELKKAVWWGIAYDTLTDNAGKDVTLIQKKVSKMFEKYPPPTKK